jgi:hypothetical protein
MKYHYTIGLYLPDIIKSGVIRLATAFVFRKEEEAVWFSTNKFYEHTAAKAGRTVNGRIQVGDMEFTHQNGGGLVRIAVEDHIAPVSWTEYLVQSGIDFKFAALLTNSGIEQGGKPQQWFCSWTPVESKHWLSIEKFDWNKKLWFLA